MYLLHQGHGDVEHGMRERMVPASVGRGSQLLHIAAKELILIVIGAVVGGVPGKVAESWPTVTILQF